MKGTTKPLMANLDITPVSTAPWHRLTIIKQVHLLKIQGEQIYKISGQHCPLTLPHYYQASPPSWDTGEQIWQNISVFGISHNVLRILWWQGLDWYEVVLQLFIADSIFGSVTWFRAACTGTIIFDRVVWLLLVIHHPCGLQSTFSVISPANVDR